jgi:hypothetical protein
VFIILKHSARIWLRSRFYWDLSFAQPDGKNTFSEIFNIVNHVQLGSISSHFVSDFDFFGIKLSFTKN